MPPTTRKNAREWQRLWRGGAIITEIDGDDPRMPRARTCLPREALPSHVFRNIKDVML